MTYINYDNFEKGSRLDDPDLVNRIHMGFLCKMILDRVIDIKDNPDFQAAKEKWKEENNFEGRFGDFCREVNKEHQARRKEILDELQQQYKKERQR